MAGLPQRRRDPLVIAAGRNDRFQSAGAPSHGNAHRAGSSLLSVFESWLPTVVVVAASPPHTRTSLLLFLAGPRDSVSSILHENDYPGSARSRTIAGVGSEALA